MTTRTTLARFGPLRGGVRVLRDVRADVVRVQWYEGGQRRVRSFPQTKAGVADAVAWAEGFWRERQSPTPRARLTIRELWEAYTAAMFTTLRPRTQAIYADGWRKFELFTGRAAVADDVTPTHLDRLRTALRHQGLAVKHVGTILGVVKLVFAWGELRELLPRNRLAAYRYRVAKEDRPRPPAEFSGAEIEQLLAGAGAQRRETWRVSVLMLLAAHQGARLNAILHLTWDDVQGDRLVWRARWDKTGRERTQPLTWGGHAALLTARWWAARDAYAGPWVFYSPHRAARAAAGAAVPWQKQSALAALTRLERRVGVLHQRGRGAHGFRRAVAGDVLRATRDPKLALDFIGDQDLRRAREYLQERDEDLVRAAVAMDATRNRHASVIAPTAWTPTEKEVTMLEAFAQCADQESNLEPSDAEPPHHDRKSRSGKRSRKTRASENRPAAAAGDPETVTKASRRRASGTHYSSVLQAVRRALGYPEACQCCGEQAADLHLDHCHRTHRLRGWCCRSCNTILGLIDTGRRMPDARFVAYLGRAGLQVTVPERPPGGDETDSWVSAEEIAAYMGLLPTSLDHFGVPFAKMYSRAAVNAYMAATYRKTNPSAVVTPTLPPARVQSPGTSHRTSHRDPR